LKREYIYIPEVTGQYKSAQSANLGLPILGASKPTSLQKFQASNATLTFGLFIPGSPIADTYFFAAAADDDDKNEKDDDPFVNVKPKFKIRTNSDRVEPRKQQQPMLSSSLRN
jgi:hypothetical protein